MERAVAIYQAMIEFNSFCPTMLLQAEKQVCSFVDLRTFSIFKQSVAVQFVKGETMHNFFDFSQERLDFLEAFWDSAVPRFGENEAKGWNHWVQSKGEVPFSSMYSPGE